MATMWNLYLASYEFKHSESVVNKSQQQRRRRPDPLTRDLSNKEVGVILGVPCFTYNTVILLNSLHFHISDYKSVHLPINQ